MNTKGNKPLRVYYPPRFGIARFKITNHADGAIVRERISGAGKDRAFWFGASGAQIFTTDLYAKNFERPQADITIDKRAARLN